MFEWLEQEISAIKTPQFHLVEGPADAKLEEAVTQSGLPLSKAYMEFVLKFGNAKLYRRSRNGYRIRVLAGPTEATLSDGTHIYHIGVNDGAKVYMKRSARLIEPSIFEFELDEEEKVAESFEEWLTESCARARNTYGKKKWAEILRGSEPFTPVEQELLETRRGIKWRVTGIDERGNHLFEVTNTGSRSLPFLTVGLRSTDGELNGAVRLDIQNIGPGQTGILHVGCYKKFRPPKEIEVFALPEPRPEEREYYYEFGKR